MNTGHVHTDQNSYQMPNMGNHHVSPQVQTQQPMSSGVGQSNMLLVFTPKRVGKLALRPMQFTFTESAINEVHDFALRGKALTDLDDTKFLKESIMPASMGTQMDTTFIDTAWTFTLVYGKE